MIKKFLLGITTLMLLLVNTSFSDLQKYTLTVKVKGYKNTNGQIGLALYNNENQYTDNPWKNFKKSKSLATKSVVTFTLKNIEQGKYAVTFLDDENSNDKMDYAFWGFPEEGFGFSNNAKPGMLSPPDYEKCTFDLNADKEITVNVQYWSE